MSDGEGLDLRYRPRRFGDIAGQKYAVAVLHGMCRLNKIPSALLFHGTPGSGKTTSARIVAAALNCQAEPGSAKVWPCAECPSCKAVIDGTSLDCMEIDAASNGTVERIREIRQLVQYGTGGQYRVVILDEVHSMSRDAFNAVLKVLEEPPPRTVWVLCTTERGKIPVTVDSRCHPFQFTYLTPPVIAGRLREVCAAEGIEATDELLAALAERAGGIMRNGLKLLDQASSVGISGLSAWQMLTGEEDYAPGLLAAAAQGNHARVFEELDRVLMAHSDYPAITAEIVSCLRDVLVLQSGGTILAQGAALEGRRKLAHNTDKRRVVEAMKVLWDLQVRVRTEDRRAGLELAAAMLIDRLCPPVSDGKKAASNGHLAVVTDLTGMEGFVPALVRCFAHADCGNGRGRLHRPVAHHGTEAARARGARTGHSGCGRRPAGLRVSFVCPV